MAPETIKDNARFFGSIAEVPRLAVTMGVGTILDSRRCLLLGYGASKADAIAAARNSPSTTAMDLAVLDALWH